MTRISVGFALASAVAVMCAAPAQAQTSNVEIYGRLNLGLDQYQAEGSAAGGTSDYRSRMRVYDGASRVGVRGSEDLGDGVRAVLQIETGVNVDTGNANGQSGVNNPYTGFWASRDSFVGIEGDNFGRMTLGHQSLYWSNGTIEQIGANYVNASSPLASYNISGIVVGPGARESNVVQYSVRSGGASMTLSYGLPTGPSSSNGESAGPGISKLDKIYAATARYNHPAFDLQLDWAKRFNVAGVEGRSITGVKLGGAWKYAQDAQVSLIVQDVWNDNTFGLGAANLTSPANLGLGALAGACGPVTAPPGAAFFTTGNGGTIDRCADTEQMSWVVSWEQIFGNVQALAQYGAAGNVKVTNSTGSLADTKVQTMMVGARYLVSRRTALYATFNQIKNGAGNYVDYWGAWMTSAQNLGGAAPGLSAQSSGADPRIVAVGVMHSF